MVDAREVERTQGRGGRPLKLRNACRVGLVATTLSAGLASALSGAAPLAFAFLIGALLVYVRPFGVPADVRQLAALDRELRLNRRDNSVATSVIGVVWARASFVLVTRREKIAPSMMWHGEVDVTVGRSLKVSLRHQSMQSDPSSRHSSSLAKSSYL